MIALLLALAPLQAAGCAPPAELAGWARTTPLAAGTRAADAAVLEPGHAVQSKLSPTAAVTFVPAPARPAAAGSSGGVFALTIATAGRYRVALGGGAWIDIVRDGRPATSVAHAHGAACTGIRKMVDFDLTPGRYLLHIASSTSPAVTLLVARLLP